MIPKNKALKLLCATALSMSVSTHAIARSKPVAVHGDWAVYTNADSGDTICYVLSKPKSKAPNSVNHGEIYFMVSTWKSGAAKEQPSLMTGYTIKAEIPPAAIVGGAKTPMFASRNEAFIEEDEDERRLVRNMKKGATMRVDAVSTRGTQTSYEFSLKGVTAALQKAAANCR